MDKPRLPPNQVYGPTKVATGTNPQSVVDEDASPGQPRWRLAMLLNFLIVAFGAALTALMLVSMKKVRKYLEFVDGFDGGDFLMILSVAGFVSALVGLLGATLTFLATSLRKYRRIRFLILAYIGWSAGLVMLTGTAFWMTFTAAGALDLAFRPGFTASLSRYQKEANVKNSIDAAQTDLQCCGNFNYTEWYTVQWTDGAIKSDVAIPQSCCDTETAAALSTSCVTQAPFGESSRLTPLKTGCVPAMVAYYGKLLKKGSFVLLGIAATKGFILLLVFMEARDPAIPPPPPPQIAKPVPTQVVETSKKPVTGKKTKKKKKAKKDDDDDDDDDDSDDDGKPGKGKSAMLASPFQAPMPYPPMSYPYGFGAAPPPAPGTAPGPAPAPTIGMPF